VIYIFTPREGLQICFWLYLTKQILQQATHDGVMMEEATAKNINHRSSYILSESLNFELLKIAISQQGTRQERAHAGKTLIVHEKVPAR